MTDSISIIAPRKIHSTGHVDLCYIPGDRQLLTCGSDGDVHIFSKSSDDKPESYSAGDCVTAIASLKSSFFAIGDDHKLTQYSIETGEYEATLARLVAAGTHLVLNSAGTHLYFGCCDFEVRSVKISSGDLRLFTGHKAPILSVAVNNKDTYLASSSCDGTVKLWQLDEGIELKSLKDVVTPSNDFSASESLCRIQFGGKDHENIPDHCYHTIFKYNVTGEFLAIPIKQGEVEVYSVPDCTLLYSLEDPLVDETLSLACFSNCNDYLAAGGAKGRIIVWHIPTRKIHYSATLTAYKTSITSMAFCPKMNELTFCDASGKISALLDVLPSSDASFYNNDVEDEPMEQEDLFDDGNDLEALMESGAIDDSITQGPHLESDNDTNDSFSLSKLKKEYQDIRALEGQELNEAEKDEGKTPAVKELAKVALVAPPTTKLQPSFQPSSSPLHLSHRFMVWNDIGAVLQYNTEEESSIVAEFHDVSTHHTLHVSNANTSYTMAALSVSALVLASPGITDEDLTADYDAQDTSVLYCHHFSSLEDNKEWSIRMNDNESIEAIAVGREHVVAATSNRTVRVFTVQGVQLDTVVLCGPVVSMSVCTSPYASTALLMLVYHSGMGIPGDQCLGMKFLNLDRRNKRRNRNLRVDSMSCERIPLSPKATLQWLGFSVEGTPFYADSRGTVYMLNRTLGNNWSPVANTRTTCKGKSDNFFIIGINENPQQLRAVLCRGTTHPMILPRPSITLLSFKLPLCEMNTEKSQMEEKLLRSTLFMDRLITLTKAGESIDQQVIQDSLIEQQETLMKLFALACKSSRDARAIELASRMTSASTVQLAIRYVVNLRPSTSAHIAKSLADIAREKLAMEETVNGAGGGDSDDGLYDDEEEDDDSDGITGDVLKDIDIVGNGHEDNFSEMMFDNTNEEGDDSEEEKVLKPKPSKMVRLKVKKRTNDEDHKKTQYLCADTRLNPFKISQATEQHKSRGSSVFDNMKIKTKDITPKKPTKPKGKAASAVNKNIGPLKKQTKMFASSKSTAAPSASGDIQPKPKTKKSTAFSLWYEVNSTTYADLDEGGTLKAAKDFKNLTAEIKKEWVDKATDINGADPETKKRKLNSTSKSTTQKLAMFAAK